MNKFKNIFFDLDGTLIDTQTDIYNSYNLAAEKIFGVSIDNISFKIGPPLEEIVKSSFENITNEEILNFINTFRSIYTDCGFSNTFCYSGIVELLKMLLAMGKRMFIATNKPRYLTNRIIKKLNIDYFDDLVTIDSVDGLILSKKEMISLLIKNNKIDQSLAIMIGDSFSDIKSAQENSISTVGVGYGYGLKEQILSAAPDFYFDTVAQLTDFFYK